MINFPFLHLQFFFAASFVCARFSLHRSKTYAKENSNKIAHANQLNICPIEPITVGSIQFVTNGAFYGWDWLLMVVISLVITSAVIVPENAPEHKLAFHLGIYIIACSYCCSSRLGSFFILYPFMFCVLKCGSLCNKTSYNVPWRATESECWTWVLKDLNLQLEWSSLFLLKDTFILTEGTSKKAKREIHCLEVTKESVMNIGQHSWRCVLVVVGESASQDPHQSSTQNLVKEGCWAMPGLFPTAVPYVVQGVGNHTTGTCR